MCMRLRSTSVATEAMLRNGSGWVGFGHFITRPNLGWVTHILALGGSGYTRGYPWVNRC